MDRLSGMTETDWRGIGPGSTVWFSTPQGNTRKGKVVMSFTTHLVLNCGGRHGMPAVVDNNNYMRHKDGRKTK